MTRGGKRCGNRLQIRIALIATGGDHDDPRSSFVAGDIGDGVRHRSIQRAFTPWLDPVQRFRPVAPVGVADRDQRLRGRARIFARRASSCNAQADRQSSRLRLGFGDHRHDRILHHGLNGAVTDPGRHRLGPVENDLDRNRGDSHGGRQEHKGVEEARHPPMIAKTGNAGRLSAIVDRVGIEYHRAHQDRFSVLVEKW